MLRQNDPQASETPNRKLRDRADCPTGRRYSPPVHIIKLTKEREIDSYQWVRPDDER